MRARAATAPLGFSAVGAAANAVFTSEASVATFSLVTIVYAAVGWLIVRRQPANRVGWLLLAFGVLSAVMGVAGGWDVAAHRFGLPGSDAIAWLQGWIWAPIVGITALVMPLFPDGRLPSRRWRVVPWLCLGFVVPAAVGNGFYPHELTGGRVNPYALHGATAALDALRNLAGVFLLATLVGGVAALTTRYRRAGQSQRQQLKWFLAAAAFLPVAVVVGELADQRLQPVVMPVALALLAAAIGVAILRHGLYDIDRIISRTVAYGLLTVLLAAIYLGAVTALTTLTAPVTRESPVAVAAATLLAAAAFQPLRRRVQGLVDRRFNRARFDAAREVDAYRGRLRGQLDLTSVGDDLTATVRTTLEPAAIVLWLPGEGPA